MGQAYQVILEALVARGFTSPRARIRLPRLRLLGIVLRNLF
jgi:phytoene synthase